MQVYCVRSSPQFPIGYSGPRNVVHPLYYNTIGKPDYKCPRPRVLYRDGGHSGSGPVLILHGEYDNVTTQNGYLLGGSFEGYLATGSYVRYSFTQMGESRETYSNDRGRIRYSVFHYSYSAVDRALNRVEVSYSSATGTTDDSWSSFSPSWPDAQTFNCVDRKPYYTVASLVELDDVVDYGTPSFDWGHGEWDLWESIKLVGHPLQNYHRCGANEAYYAAVANMPQANTNTLANLLEVAEAARSLLRGDLGGISGSGTWLAYRYCYCTSKSDIQEYAKITRRIADLASASAVRLNGASSFKDWNYSCTLTIPSSQVVPTSTPEVLESYGLKLSLYNAWDMVPYSFIVDWFANIGDWLYNLEHYGECVTINPSDCWFSATTNGGRSYVRWAGERYQGIPPRLCHMGEASNKTILLRIADTIALLRK